MERNMWIIIRPDRPFIIESDLINNEHADSTPIQVVCGHDYSAILTRSGEIYIMWPFDEYVIDAYKKQYEGSSTGLEIKGNSISCKTWKLKYDLYKLPQIGDLPELNQRDRSPGSNSPPKIIKIAAMYNRLFGITDDGHILSITGVESRAEIGDKHWTYVIILHIFFRYPKIDDDYIHSSKRVVFQRKDGKRMYGTFYDILASNNNNFTHLQIGRSKRP